MFVHQSRSKLVNSGPWLLISVKLNADQLFWLKTSPAQQWGVFVTEVYWEMLTVAGSRRLWVILWESKQIIALCQGNKAVWFFQDQTGYKNDIKPEK